MKKYRDAAEYICTDQTLVYTLKKLLQNAKSIALIRDFNIEMGCDYRFYLLTPFQKCCSGLENFIIFLGVNINFEFFVL